MKLSAKKTKQNNELHRVYQEMDLEAVQGEGIICSGCGRGLKVDHSHILSRKQHESLITDPDNIVYDCKSIGEHKGCHDKWEEKNPSELLKLKNIGYRLEYVMKHDSKLFWELTDKINEYLKDKS